MNELKNNLLSTEAGRAVYENAIRAINDFRMHDLLCGGIVIGLSGGADSVALLLVLLEYTKQHNIPIKAVHINHSIRGEEADFDEAFSRELCNSLNVEFEAYRIDVPAIAKSQGLGIEEAARNARYEKFSDIVSSDSRFSAIAVAHNATDNLETVIFNMMRGSGIMGMCGIKPVRNNIVRPLIYSSKELICNALNSAGIGFVVDSTNFSSEYTRNYIRNEILPKLKKISDSPEKMCTRVTSSLREDNEYLNCLAEVFFEKHENNGSISKNAILSLHKPVFSRVLMIWCKNLSLPSPEKVHIDTIFSKLKGNDFSLSLPGNRSFIMAEDRVYISAVISENKEFFCEIKEGINKFPEFDNIIVLSKDKNYDCFSNIYKKSIQVKIKFDIINNGLRIRSKAEGDSYRFGNMTRKLKKLFNDRKIPLSKRSDIPIFCDKKGILWVPGFAVRDGASVGEDWYITIFEPLETDRTGRCFFIANNRLQKGVDIT